MNVVRARPAAHWRQAGELDSLLRHTLRVQRTQDSFCLPPIRSVVQVCIASWAPAPCPSSTASALSSVVVASASLDGRGRSHEGEVYGEFLVEPDFVVGALDCGLGIFEQGEFDESVALFKAVILCVLYRVTSCHVP